VTWLLLTAEARRKKGGKGRESQSRKSAYKFAQRFRKWENTVPYHRKMRENCGREWKGRKGELEGKRI